MYNKRKSKNLTLQIHQAPLLSLFLLKLKKRLENNRLLILQFLLLELDVVF